jgi:hypothetical protein
LEPIVFQNQKAGKPASKRNPKGTLFGVSFARGAVQCGLLGADYRKVFSVLINLKPGQILFRDRHIRKDRFDRALRKASITIDACVRIDQEFVRQFVKSLDRAHGGTIGVFTVDTRFGNDVCHLQESLPGHEGEMAKLKP